MKINPIHIRVIAISFWSILLTSCEKERKWETEIITINEEEPGEIRVEADFYLPRNDNYVYAGVCLSEISEPKVNDVSKEGQVLDTDIKSYFFEGLESQTPYFFRSYIRTSSGNIIYSEEDVFITQDGPAIPCETEAGIVEFSGSSMGMTNLSESTGDYYTFDTYSEFGDLTFTFRHKPVAKMYKTVDSDYDLTESTVHVDGILGYGFSCYYRNATNMDVYVTMDDENEDISIAFCDLKLSTGGSCEDFYLLSGKVHQ